jgi:hypothetical protein
VCVVAEVIRRLLREPKVAQIDETRDRRRRQHLALERRLQHPGCGHDRRHHEHQRRQQAPQATRVERDEVDPSGRLGLAQQQPRDQEPGDHEEDVDADVAARDDRGPGMEQHDERHRDGTHSLHLREKPG